MNKLVLLFFTFYFLDSSFAGEVEDFFIKKLGGKTQESYCKTSSIMGAIENGALKKAFINHKIFKECEQIVSKGKGGYSDPNFWKSRFDESVRQTVDRIFYDIEDKNKQKKLVEEMFVKIENTEKLRKYFIGKLNSGLFSIFSAKDSFSINNACKVLAIHHVTNEEFIAGSKNIYGSGADSNENFVYTYIENGQPKTSGTSKADQKKYYMYCQYLYSDKKNADYAIKNLFPTDIPSIIDNLVIGPANTESKIDQILKIID